MSPWQFDFRPQNRYDKYLFELDQCQHEIAREGGVNRLSVDNLSLYQDHFERMLTELNKSMIKSERLYYHYQTLKRIQLRLARIQAGITSVGDAKPPSPQEESVSGSGESTDSNIAVWGSSNDESSGSYDSDRALEIVTENQKRLADVIAHGLSFSEPELVSEDLAGLHPNLLLRNSSQSVGSIFELSILTKVPNRRNEYFDDSVRYPERGGVLADESKCYAFPSKADGTTVTLESGRKVVRLIDQSKAGMSPEKISRNLVLEAQHVMCRIEEGELMCPQVDQRMIDEVVAVRSRNSSGAIGREEITQQYLAAIIKVQQEFNAYWLSRIMGDHDEFGSPDIPAENVPLTFFHPTIMQSSVIPIFINQLQESIVTHVIQSEPTVRECFFESKIFQNFIFSLSEPRGCNLINSPRIHRMILCLERFQMSDELDESDIRESLSLLTPSDKTFLKTSLAQPFWDVVEGLLRENQMLYSELRTTVWS